MTQFRKLSASLCLAAAMSMTATPALAVELPVHAAPASTPDGVEQWDTDAVNAERYRHRRYRHRRNRVDAGDVIAGVLILGGIAAIADAASKPRRERSYPVQQPRYQERRGERSSQSGTGLDRAVTMCLSEIERDVRVENVDNVQRTGSGWNVSGTIYNGDPFTCQIDNDGRVSNVSFGGQVAAVNSEGSLVQDRQYDDATYRQARQDADQGQTQTALVTDEPAGAQPAYPGGPIDGDLVNEEELGG